MGVAVCGYDFKDAVVQVENRDIERAATQIVYGDGPVLLLIKPVGKRGRGWLVHKPKHL